MRVDETCACGASISVEADSHSRTSYVVETWRVGHRHVDPEPTVLEAVAEPFDFAAAIRDEVAEQLRAQRDRDTGKEDAPVARCERKISDSISDSILCVLTEGHTEAHRFFLPDHKEPVAWPVECICTLRASMKSGTIRAIDGNHLPTCPIAIS